MLSHRCCKLFFEAVFGTNQSLFVRIIVLIILKLLYVWHVVHHRSHHLTVLVQLELNLVPIPIHQSVFPDVLHLLVALLPVVLERRIPETEIELVIMVKLSAFLSDMFPERDGHFSLLCFHKGSWLVVCHDLISHFELRVTVGGVHG